MPLLPTAMVKIYIKNEFIGFHRALCDTGSQSNIVSFNIVKDHYQNGIDVRNNVIGINNKPIKIKKKIEMSIQPWFDSSEYSKISSNFWVLPKSNSWNPILPESNVSCASMKDNLKTP